MARADIELVPGLDFRSAGLEKSIRHSDQFGDKFGGHQALDAKVSMLEIMLALALRQNAWRMREDFFRRHERTSWPVSRVRRAVPGLLRFPAEWRIVAAMARHVMSDGALPNCADACWKDEFYAT